MNVDEIRESFEARGIKKAKIGGFDVDGVLRGKLVSLDKLWSALDKGFGFKGEHNLSELARRYIAGQVKLMPDLTAVYAPFINSYRRYVPGVWAPLNATWGIENRTCAIRVIRGPGERSVRAESRQTAADINPYLAMAASVGAGLYGITHALELGPPSSGDASASDHEATPLPRSLRDATAALAKSEGAREVLSDAFVDHYVRTRDWECREADRAVTDWELRRYFEGV